MDAAISAWNKQAGGDVDSKLKDDQITYLKKKAGIADAKPEFPHVLRMRTKNKHEINKVTKLLDALNMTGSAETKLQALEDAASINTGIWANPTNQLSKAIADLVTTGHNKFKK